MHYLNSATETLDVCMYLLTCPLLAKAIIKAHNRGVVVRMVIDESMVQNASSTITMEFYRNGTSKIKCLVRFTFKHAEKFCTA